MTSPGVHPRPGPRGFTLVELLVSLVVVAFMTAGAVALVGQQQRAVQNTSAERALQETARTALSHIGENLLQAGYGMEPHYAFDFGPLAVTAVTPQILSQPYQCGTEVACRDGSGDQSQDEIVFHYRNPAFSHALAAAPAGASPTAITIAGGISSPLYEGQILQVMCDGAGDWAYVTVGATANANWVPPAAAPASTDITLGTDSGNDAFPAQNARLSRSCFTSAPATVRVFKIDRFRYYVAWFPEDGVPRPYLMLDRGYADRAAPPEPVAPDIEDLQVTYLFPNATTNQVVGGTLGTALANAATSISLSDAPPLFNAADNAPTRQNHSPANIRAVRVSVVSRTPGVDIRLRDVAVSANVQSSIDLVNAGNLVPGAGNRGDWAGDSGHHRFKVETTFSTRNLNARVPNFPAYTTNNGADGLNVGGG